MPYINSANPGAGQNQPFNIAGYVTDIEVDDTWAGGAVKPGTLMQLTYLGFTPDPEITGDGAYNYPTVIPWVQEGASNVLGVCVGGPTLGADTYPTDGSSVVNAGAMVLTEGFCQVLCDNTTVVGDYLIPSATTQGAASDGGTTPTVPTIGTVLEAVTISSGTALVWAYVRLAGAGGGGGGGVPRTVVDADAAGSPYTPQSGVDTWFVCDCSGGPIDILASATPVSGEIITVTAVDNGSAVITFDPLSVVVAPGTTVDFQFDPGTSLYVELKSPSGVDSVVAGANIAVDDTDPANPIVALATNVDVAGTLTAGANSFQDGSNNATITGRLTVDGLAVMVGSVRTTGVGTETAYSAYGLPATTSGQIVNNDLTIDVCSATSLTGSGTCDVEVSHDGVTYTDLGSVELTTTTVFTFGQLRAGWYLKFTPTGTVAVGNTVFS